MLRIAFPLLLFPAIATAGELAELCAERDTVGAVTCQCIETSLIDGLGEEDAALYARVSAQYFQNRDQDQSMADAWDAAVRTEAEIIGSGFIPLLERTNEMGKLHREVIDLCK